MNARPLLLSLVVALVAAPGLADAQKSASATLKVQPFERVLHASDSLGAAAVLQYSADPTVYLSLEGVPVTYSVTKQPAWATVVLSPQSDIIPVQVQPQTTFNAMRSLQVLVDIPGDATGDLVDLIEVTATIRGGALGIPLVVKASVPLHLVAGPHACPDAAPAPARDDAPATVSPQPSAPVKVQSASMSVPTISGVALAGFALVGAGVGLVLRRRK